MSYYEIVKYSSFLKYQGTSVLIGVFIATVAIPSVPYLQRMHGFCNRLALKLAPYTLLVPT